MTDLMEVFVDIHTHQLENQNYYSIINFDLQQAEKFLSTDTSFFCSIGIHPWKVASITKEEVFQLKKWENDSRWIAVGECGLDKNSKASLTLQQYFFEKQITLSEKLKKPLIIHCVKCFNEIIEIKKNLNPNQKWIIHGFRGKPQLAIQLLNNNIGISYGEKFNPQSVEITPFEQLYVETDESKLPISTIYQQIALVKHCAVTKLNAGKKLLDLKENNNLLI